MKHLGPRPTTVLAKYRKGQNSSQIYTFSILHAAFYFSAFSTSKNDAESLQWNRIVDLEGEEGQICIFFILHTITNCKKIFAYILAYIAFTFAYSTQLDTRFWCWARVMLRKLVSKNLWKVKVRPKFIFQGFWGCPVPTLTSLIKRRIVKDRKSEQVGSQMQMWIPLQEIVTWSAARHKRKEEKREGEHLHFFSCRIMWVGGWVREGVTDLDLLVFVFVFVLLHVFLVIQNYVWECVVGSLIHLIKIGLDRWGAGDEKGEKFCVELLQPMIRQLLTIGVLE